MTLPDRAGDRDRDACRSAGPEGLTEIYLLGLVQGRAECSEEKSEAGSEEKSEAGSEECSEENSEECSEEKSLECSEEKSVECSEENSEECSEERSAECSEEKSAECMCQCRVMFRVHDKCISEHKE